MGGVLRVAMVTGAAGNVGSAVASRFQDAGFQLVLLDRSFAELATTHPRPPLRLPLDLEDESSVQLAVQDAMTRYGRIDVLCNIAGGFTMGEAVHESTDATWRAMLGTNLNSTLNPLRAVIPHMIAAGSGRVINVAAMAGLAGVARMSAYSASKSAVIRITESMSAELRRSGINVNCVMPSIVDTPANRAAMPQADASRWVSAQSLAEVMFFLASDASRAIHGAAIPVVGLV
jgi:NAD(P)-dependent dehydrogenase (short-subunit alcohol dehydrogenase family)